VARQRSRWIALGGGAVVAAAAVLLLLRRPEDPGETRVKGGGTRLSFYVKHDGVVRVGGADEPVFAGDALRFAYTTREARYFAVLSLDGAHHASVYYPPSPVAVRAPPGVNVALPSSTVLDEALGVETLYGIFCPDPFELEPVRGALAESPPGSSKPEVLSRWVDGLRARGVLTGDCAIETATLRKEAPTD
jgi:hypothetical protein